jgi:hypothetical protein
MKSSKCSFLAGTESRVPSLHRGKQYTGLHTSRVRACDSRLEELLVTQLFFIRSLLIMSLLDIDMEKLIKYCIQRSFAQHLKRFPEVFLVEAGEANMVGAYEGSTAGFVCLVQSLSSPLQRTAALQKVLEALKREGLIPGWRDEVSISVDDIRNSICGPRVPQTFFERV